MPSKSYSSMCKIAHIKNDCISKSKPSHKKWHFQIDNNPRHLVNLETISWLIFIFLPCHARPTWKFFSFSSSPHRMRVSLSITENNKPCMNINWQLWLINFYTFDLRRKCCGKKSRDFSNKRMETTGSEWVRMKKRDEKSIKLYTRGYRIFDIMFYTLCSSLW